MAYNLQDIILSKDGAALNPNTIKAITEFPEPKDKKDAQRLLEVVNYMSKYIPNYSQETKPLRDLLKKDIIFKSDDHHKAAFQRILKYSDPSKKIVVSVAAS